MGKVETYVGWHFPEEDWVKCNVDGACLYGGALTGCGGVIRDSTGHWVAGFKKCLGSGSVLSAELWGMVHGLELAWAQGFRRVWLESDSLTAVTLVKNGCHHSHQFFSLIQRIQRLVNNNWQIRISHTHREGNRVADILAGEGVLSDISITVFTDPPSCCVNSLRDDQSGVCFPRSVPALM